VVRSGADDATRALAAAASAQRDWAATPPMARAAILRDAAALLRDRSETVAAAMTAEEGKPLVEARAEVARTGELLEATASLVYQPSGEIYPSRRSAQWLLTTRAPLGVVVVIAPWNFPLLIPAWKIAPALLAGNAVVLKPAELTPLTAAHLVDVLHHAGLPPGVLNVVFGSGGTLGPALLQPPAVGVSFTGGNATGRAVATAAVEQHLKFQLELGGSNPVLVLADADLEHAAREIVTGAVSGSGQKCTATRRVFVERAVHGELVEGIRALLSQAVLAPGSDPACTVAPLVSATARDDFLAGAEAVASQADVERFGRLPDDGYFVQPCLASGADPDAPIFAEEIFGPLVAVFEVAGLDEGIRRCNATPYGLSASLFSSSLRSALTFAEHVDAGMIHVNSQTTGAEPHLPFGGTKRSSSYSREVGRHGLEFFSQVKTLYLEGA
jgi:aldehyde dehydrogenase (NAD+)